MRLTNLYKESSVRRHILQAKSLIGISIKSLYMFHLYFNAILYCSSYSCGSNALIFILNGEKCWTGENTQIKCYSQSL